MRSAMTATALPPIAVVVPAYVAEKSIGAVLSGIPPFVRDIVVVDDGSSDGTSAAARTVADSRVRVIRHEANRGVGAAVLTGYDAAVALGAEVIVKMDADGQMDPRSLLLLVNPIVRGTADYAKGNRFLHGPELRDMPLKRRIGNAGLSFLTKLASGYWPIFDPTNGYTAIHASVIPALDRSRIAERYFFETSVLLDLSRLRAVVIDVYIAARYAGERSGLSERRAVIEFLPQLIGASWSRFVRQYFVQDFTAVSLFVSVGALLAVFGFLWGMWHWAVSVRDGVPATTGTVMLAVLPLIVGIQLLVQAIAQDITNVPTVPIQLALGSHAIDPGPAD